MRLHLRSKLKRLSLATLTYAFVLLIFRRYDLIIFTEIGIYVEKVKSPSVNALSPSQYHRAFHLDDKFRNLESNVILYWSPPFGTVNPIGHSANGCVHTYDRSSISVAKAVLFHFAEIQDDPYWLPLNQRKASQWWIWFCQEPPTLTRDIFHKSLTPLNGIFNLTMTYRTDSDLKVTYQRPVVRSNRTVEEILKNKRSSAVGLWVVSNCKSSFRNDIIQQLQQHIKIDIKGKCSGEILCRGPCQNRVINSYKFIFAFENSCCQDYITEKFFYTGVNTEAVPVVLGPPRSSYEKYVPGGSFIHVDDFKNIEELGRYLKYLNENDSEYKKFLKWKSNAHTHQDYSATTVPNAMRTLCNKIKNGPMDVQVIDHLDTWWYGDQYNPGDSKSTLSVCQHEEGSSGKDYHFVFVVCYHLVLLLFYIITCIFIHRAYRCNGFT